VDSDGTYIAARALQRAGQWDLALRQAPPDPALRAEILTDRHLWRLDPVDEAVAAIAEISGDLAEYLTAQLEYWRLLLHLGDTPRGGDPVAAFAGLRDGPLRGWADFWHAVSLENLRGDGAGATPGYTRAASIAAETGDLLLESYAVRHLGGQALDAGDRVAALPLLRRSLHLRAACGARPHVAAAAAMLADALDPDPEAESLRAIVAATATDLHLTWLLPTPH
jgi:hypothetical protein